MRTAIYGTIGTIGTIRHFAHRPVCDPDDDMNERGAFPDAPRFAFTKSD